MVSAKGPISGFVSRKVVLDLVSYQSNQIFHRILDSSWFGGAGVFRHSSHKKYHAKAQKNRHEKGINLESPKPHFADITASFCSCYLALSVDFCEAPGTVRTLTICQVGKMVFYVIC